MILLKIITSIAVDFLDFWAMNTDSAMNYFMILQSMDILGEQNSVFVWYERSERRFNNGIWRIEVIK
uniref:Uncharacterized protein n=1 Tax=Manihot esculenta TaxID=3983 RepID=A0A2C9UJQ9_MANES